jgi:hypothetical protein
MALAAYVNITFNPVRIVLLEISMKYWHRLVLIVMALLAVNGSTYLVLSHNLEAGAYPVDGDSIGIPMVSTLFLSLAGALFLLSAFSLVFIGSIVRFSQKGNLHLSAVILLLVLLNLPPLFLLFLGAGFWSLPNHYLLLSTMIIMLAIVAGVLIRDIRWLISDPVLKRDCKLPPK